MFLLKALAEPRSKAKASTGTVSSSKQSEGSTNPTRSSLTRGGVSYNDLSSKLTESLKSNKSVVMSTSGDWGSMRRQITRISYGEYSVSTTTNWSFGSNLGNHEREVFSSMEKAIRYATKGLDTTSTYKLSR